MSVVNIHANCVVIGTRGVLIRGGSGSGKSVLSETLIIAAKARGHFAALVADDRVVLTSESGRLLGEPPENLVGLMEVRGFGIVNATSFPKAQIHMVVDLEDADQLERMPEEPVRNGALEGVELPFICCSAKAPQNTLHHIRWAFRHLYPQSPDYF